MAERQRARDWIGSLIFDQSDYSHMKGTRFDIAVSWDLKWRINGCPAPGDVCEFLRNQMMFEVEDWGPTNCPHCRDPMTVKTFEDVQEGNEIWYNNRTFAYTRCPTCAHWEFSGAEGGNKCMDSQSAFRLAAVASRFMPDLPDGCSSEMAQFLRRHPSFWHEIAPKTLERLVADIFKANYAATEVIHVGRPHDQGVDVVLIEADAGRWLIQVKRRAHASPAEGFSTLQSILGTLALHGERKGIIVSTADAFSYFARKGTRRAREQGFTVALIDKSILNILLTPLLPQTPWKKIFEHPDISHVDMDVQRHFWGSAKDGQLEFENLFLESLSRDLK